MLIFCLFFSSGGNRPSSILIQSTVLEKLLQEEREIAANQIKIASKLREIADKQTGMEKIMVGIQKSNLTLLSKMSIDTQLMDVPGPAATLEDISKLLEAPGLLSRNSGL